MKQLSIALLLLSTSIACIAQPKGKVPKATTAADRMKVAEERKQLTEASMVNGINFRSVGPTVMSGRVTDLAVDPKDPTHFYVAYASGGLWETKNNGMSFEPLFEQEAVMTIGDIAVNWDKNIIWVGTGENNSSRSSYSGLGVYRSADGGKTWEHRGLEDSHHIGRIQLHPTNPDKVWVAVLGHLYSPNNERGVYVTTDGGTTWKRTLEVDPNTGAIDLVIGDRTADDPKMLYAAMWDRERRAWNFVEGGDGSGIYKSMDGGESWSKVSGGDGGFPEGEGAGRIGLAVGSDDGNTVFALIDNQFRREKEEKEKDGKLTKDDLRAMTPEAFADLDEGKLATFLKDNGFPKKYNSDKVKSMVKSRKIKPIALVEYLEDANSMLFDTPVIGAELYRSDDGGKTWKKTHEDFLDDIYFSYGYYFGMLRVDPSNRDKIYIAGVPILKSDDGGKTFESINGDNVHVDHHALWINPEKTGHLINGNDGGVNISYDDGETWFKANTPAVGQFYTVNVDMETNYNVYGGLQDNGVWKGPSSYEASTSWHQRGKYPYEGIMGGDGMQIQIDSRDNETIYTGYQFGNYFRINKAKRQQEYITVKHDLGERPLRFNWQTPIHLSIHNQDILYMGSNKFHRSMNKGKDMKALSEDLTLGGIKGDVSYGTLTSIHESPLQFGLIYVGSDDGLIHMSRDGGNTWKLISDALPSKMWVSRVQASAHKVGTVYASLNGYRWDHFNSYVYVSRDYGKSWIQIGLNLPDEPVNVIKEDPKNENILYVGTDHGIYVSLDGGTTFMRMGADMPAVAVHDLVIHPKANDLVVGTHGRSIYIANVEHLQELDDETMKEKLFVFDVDPVTHRGGWGSSWSKWIEARSPKIHIPLWQTTGAEKATVEVMMEEMQLFSFEADLLQGLNYLPYELELNGDVAKKYAEMLNKDLKEKDPKISVEKASNGKYYLQPGEYTLRVKAGSESKETTLEIKKPKN